jgi:hypothetical protein
MFLFFCYFLLVNSLYDLSKERIETKVEICHANENTCNSACISSVLINICDPVDMNWNCQCADGLRNISIPEFEVEIIQCQRETHECEVNCIKGKENMVDRDYCINDCAVDRKCGTPSGHSTISFYNSSFAIEGNNYTIVHLNNNKYSNITREFNTNNVDHQQQKVLFNIILVVNFLWLIHYW